MIIERISIRPINNSEWDVLSEQQLILILKSLNDYFNYYFKYMSLKPFVEKLLSRDLKAWPEIKLLSIENEGHHLKFALERPKAELEIVLKEN